MKGKPMKSMEKVVMAPKLMPPKKGKPSSPKPGGKTGKC